MNKRIFTLGSEWFYMKIYSGPKTLENIFINKIYTKILHLVNRDFVDYFFFIRYHDPDYHIRLRLHLKHTDSIGEVILFLMKEFEDYISNHVISKIIIDTYSREIERYSDEYINDVERVFYFDSFFILNYLTKCNADDMERWLVSSKYIDFFLNSCGFSLSDKIEFCGITSSSLSKEIYSDAKFVNKQISEKYRSNRKIITAILEKDSHQQYDWINDLKNYLSQIKFFTEKIKPKNEEKNSSELFPLLNSVIHMHVNRMFRTKQRLNECVIYNLLLKYYRSKNIILKNNADENNK